MDLKDIISVVLVEPKYQGNIGAVARSMANSGIVDLRIVKTMPETEAYYRSMHGRYILENAKIFENFEDAIEGFEIVVGTSDISKSGEKFSRVPISPEDFWNKYGLNGQKVALVFGREDNGLHNTELKKCNFFIKLIGNPEYPVYNLSHAVAIILYEMVKIYYSSNVIARKDLITNRNMEILIKRINQMLSMIDYNDSERSTLLTMLNKIIGRSELTESEFYKIMGILRQIINRIS